MKEPLEVVRPGHADIRRFWSKVHIYPKEGMCWIWRGYVDKDGYGQVKIGYRNYKVHRLAYAIAHGLCPADMTVHHTCLTPSCVRPAHLELVTGSENLAEANSRNRRGNAVPTCRLCGRRLVWTEAVNGWTCNQDNCEAEEHHERTRYQV